MEILIIECFFIDNEAHIFGGSIFVQGEYPLSTKLRIKESNFTDALGPLFGTMLFIRTAQADIQACTIDNIFANIIYATDRAILKISHMSVRSGALVCYIEIHNSVTLELIESNMTNTFSLSLNGFFICASNRCSVNVSNCLFGDGNQPWMLTNVFSLSNYSYLEARNCIFENSYYSYSRFITASENSEAVFTNCLFTKTSGLQLAHSSRIYIQNSYIIGSKFTLQTYALMEIIDNSHAYISNTSFLNNTLKNKKLIFVTSNSSVSICNCMYVGNNVTNHIVVAGGNVTVTGVRFINNSVIKALTGPRGLLVVKNGSVFRMTGSLFRNNGMYGNVATLMTISTNNVTIQNCIFSNNFFVIGFSFPRFTPLIVVDSSKSIFFADITANGNTVDGFFDGRY